MEISLAIAAFLTGFVLAYAWLRGKQSLLQKAVNEANVAQSVAVAQLQEKQTELAQVREQLRHEGSKVTELHAELTKTETDLYHLRQRHEEQKAELVNLRETFLQQFNSISNQVLVQNADHFQKSSAENLEKILAPLKERIKEFEAKVDHTYEKSLKESTSLKEQIAQLAQLNNKMSEDALNLTRALKGERKTQGNWGEYLLEGLLEKSGLQRDLHYRREVVLKNDENQVYRPDVIINLPDNKHLIIDAKVSLVAYEAYCNADEEEKQAMSLRSHLLSLRTHYSELSKKNYQQLHGIHSPDFVLMYIPIEPAFNLAMQHDRDLFVEALERNIVFVTTSTLLATLRTVAGVWKQENQKRNVLKIAEESGKLYDKFAAFVDDLKDIGQNLDRTQQRYQAAMNKLSTGKGNLIRRVEHIKQLGARTSKTINDQLLQDAQISKPEPPHLPPMPEHIN
ncbi:MAG: DNA recombination protein RmuC [Hymenobacteraceae bacterium]|nr:DNA recombination protein RmuC [Hymenobacteraceae bacterium]MDX5395755.1 DNA recombination protein RmuC [Hymenobacteraceae bacterium]MDX5511810.1 DNA recombination protein RmuC [Hymenobacteraceae bacterium]